MTRIPSKLPSRNWMIFISVVSTWTAAVVYDRRETKKLQKKWCDLVAHQAQEPLRVNQLRRPITVVIAAPPGDGIGPTRDYFRKYCKPMMVAAQIDYVVVEGRREGDVRYGVAEKIRRFRRSKGEKGDTLEEDDVADAEEIVQKMRLASGILQEPGLKGDLVLGRHTWKEYLRGLHEGYLGPLTKPIKPQMKSSELDAPAPFDEPIMDDKAQANEDTTQPGSGADDTASEEKSEPKKEEHKEDPRASYLPISDYESAPLSPHTPTIFDPVGVVEQTHILGFLKFPWRIWNFLNQRKIADTAGGDVCAILLAANSPYQESESFASTSTIEYDNTPVATRAPESDAHVVGTSRSYEQQSVLEHEEPDWHKSTRQARKEGDTRERIWAEPVIMDPRIAHRMRKFELSDEEKSRVNRIALGLEKSKAREVKDLRKEAVWMPEEGDLD